MTRKPTVPGQHRIIFPDSSILYGQPPIIKTTAELSLEKHLQGPNRVQASNQQQVHARAGHEQGRKFHDAKPRLLLMGLRR